MKITKTERERYFKVFLFATISLLILMVINNLFWITGSPEWNTAHTVANNIGCWTGGVYDYTTNELIGYIFGYRVYTVLTNFRDIGASMVGGLIITSFVIFMNEIVGIRVFNRRFLK